MTSLATFARWIIAQPLLELARAAPAAPVTRYTDPAQGAAVTGVVLFREAPFQAELFSVAPSAAGVTLAEHRHPHVDSIEVYVSGAVRFTVRGRVVAASDRAGGPLLVRVRPTDLHGAHIGPPGAVFLSVQHWRGGLAPSSVGLDWDGPPHIARSVG